MYQVFKKKWHLSLLLYYFISSLVSQCSVYVL